jgi:thiamine-phosphate pyrophosphorylase
VSTPRERLSDAHLYLCTTACDERLLRGALDGGVDVIQLRDRSLDDDAIRRESERFRRAADDAGALFVLNDRPDLAAEVGADGVHVGQDDASPAEARAAVGPDRIVGLSTHAPEQGAAGLADPDADYLSIGPVHLTPTKPGRPATGVEYVRWAAEHVGGVKPWFAIGGIDVTTIAAVTEAGASRVVVVRAITEAADPLAAAAELRSALEVVTSGRP